MSSIERSSAPWRQRRTILVTLVVLGLIFGSLFLWRAYRMSQTPAWQQQATAVAAMRVAPQDVPVSLEAIGTLAAVREVSLSSEVAGRVTAIGFEGGAQVGAGALLVQLDDGPERADREAARIRAAFGGVQVARSEQLAATGAEPRELLDQRRADRDQAIAAVRQLDARLSQKRIRAPFAGEIGIRRVNLGQYLSPGTAVATLTDLSRLNVEFALPQQEISRLRKGAVVTVTSDGYPGRVFTARVRTIEPQIDNDTRNVAVQAVMANPGGALRPGMYVSAALALPPQAGALMVPATAIQTSPQGNTIVVVRGKTPRQGGKAHIVPVVTGRRIGNQVIVTSGLKSGDIVVVEGQLRVPPGGEVKVTRFVTASGR